MRFFAKKQVKEDEGIFASLRLARTPRVGPITYHRLIQKFGSAQAALEALPELSKIGGKSFDPASEETVRYELEKIAKLKGKIITIEDGEYPENLKAIEDAPVTLTILGDAARLNQKQIAIVGARNASLNGCKFAKRLAGELSEAGYVITSGMARGIDAAAHEGAIENGTIAVLAGGIDQIYPRENTKLYEALRAKGAVITEAAYGTAPSAHLFPRRNRIVSGLSQAVIVVEATERSGSLITARLAAEQGREVMAVPGYPTDPRAGGPNKLIRDGATLIRSAQDVLEALEAFPTLISKKVSDVVMPEETIAITEVSAAEDIKETILNTLGPHITPIDELLRACHVSVSEGQTVLLALELAGRVQRLPGNRVCLIEE